MRQKDAVKLFREMDETRRRVFVMRDFRKMFPNDNDKTLAASVAQMVRDEILERPTRGIYVFAHTRHSREHLLYEVARTLRRGSYTYLSMESALSEYGVISQIPTGHHTFMTTGRRGEFRTDYGTIEFSHTSRNPADFVPDLLEVERPLPIANMERALKDLNRVGRNHQMLQLDEIEAMRREEIDDDAELC